jgi:CheY-like chemotaxis protein
MEERRQHPRRPVAWPVRLWLDDHAFVSGRAVEASTRGAWLYLNWFPTGGFKLDDAYRLEVQHPETGAWLTCVIEIRHVSEKAVGVRLREAIPIELLDAPGARGPAEASAAHAELVARDRRVYARILIVDDHDSFREVLSHTLDEGGYRVTQAKTAAEAITAVRRDHPDLVLLDIDLPDGSGIEVLRTIRQTHPTIGTIMVTGNDDLTLAFDSIKAGALNCLFKPLSLDLLSRAVAHGLTKVRAAAVSNSATSSHTVT